MKKPLTVRPVARKVVALALLMAVGAANAADGATTIDLTPINSAIQTITSVGTLVFAVVVGIKTFQWVRRAL